MGGGAAVLDGQSVQIVYALVCAVCPLISNDLCATARECILP